MIEGLEVVAIGDVENEGYSLALFDVAGADGEEAFLAGSVPLGE